MNRAIGGVYVCPFVVIFNNPTSSHCPYLVVIKIQGYKTDSLAFIGWVRHYQHPHASTAKIMSSLTSAAFNISEELRRQLEHDYKEVLLKIKRGLTEDSEKEFRFYYTVYAETSDTLELFRLLEDAREISWKDVSSLKNGLRAVQRKDLKKELTEFENKRNLTALVYMYARKRQGFEDSSCSSCFNSVEQAATYLTKTSAQGISTDGTLKSLLESRKSIKKVIGEFDEVIKHERLDPWSRLALLVDIAGETVAEAFVMSEERRLTSEEIGKMCRRAADELYCRMPELGTWVS